MPTYIRLGIRILYQKAGQKTGAVESKRIKALLKSMSEKQGKKFTDPSSRKEILNFVKYHSIPIDEILLPLSAFNNFNEFFYRQLKVYLPSLISKPESRPIASSDPNVAVCVADCRINVFDTIEEAKRIWIKGQNFSIESFLGDEKMAKHFEGGSV
jgi:phosphatidylserine decarboxylase